MSSALEKPNLAQVYDRFAETYEANRGQFDMGPILSDFFQRLPPKGRLLDLGCGAGEPFAAAFVQRGWSVVGVDFSPKMLALAARYVPEMERICADMRQVDFPPETFDAISLIYSLFHVPRDDHPALFQKWFRWLKPGGKVLFTYATQDYTGQPEFDGYKEFLGESLYYSHHRPEPLYECLQEIGFQIEAKENRSIGGETFLWVVLAKPA